MPNLNTNDYEKKRLWQTKVTNYGNYGYKPWAGPVRIVKPRKIK